MSNFVDVLQKLAEDTVSEFNIAIKSANIKVYEFCIGIKVSDDFYATFGLTEDVQFTVEPDKVFSKLTIRYYYKNNLIKTPYLKDVNDLLNALKICIEQDTHLPSNVFSKTIGVFTSGYPDVPKSEDFFEEKKIKYDVDYNNHDWETK